MKIGVTGIAIGLIAVSGALVAAYQFGTQRQSDGLNADAAGLAQSAAAPGGVMPANHPATAGGGGSAGDNKFAHFRVGNRNVKSIYADGGVVWIGTSGG